MRYIITRVEMYDSLKMLLGTYLIATFDDGEEQTVFKSEVSILLGQTLNFIPGELPSVKVDTRVKKGEQFFLSGVSSMPFKERGQAEDWFKRMQNISQESAPNRSP